VELTVLGAGPAYSNRPGSLGSGYLLEAGGRAIVLDLGQGTFTELAIAVEPSRLDAVFVSHLHPDHFIDLVPLRHYLRYELRPPGRVAVFGPAGLAARLDALHDEPGFAVAALDVRVLAPGEVRVGPFTIEAVRVTHTADSYAVRVTDEAGGGLVYSGDCGRIDDLVPLVRPGDAVLVEVSFGTSPVPPGAWHLNADDVVELARRARPGRILLTHLQMGFDPAAVLERVRAGYEGPVRFVTRGERLVL
jgi:ribonuclease BN (tRNA processing enzyme)